MSSILQTISNGSFISGEKNRKKIKTVLKSGSHCRLRAVKLLQMLNFHSHLLTALRSKSQGVPNTKSNPSSIWHPQVHSLSISVWQWWTAPLQKRRSRMSRHQNKMFLPVLQHASKPIMCAGKAMLSKELFFKDSTHPVLAGGSEGDLILKNKVWVQVAERTFLLLGAAAHTAPAWKGFCFSRQNPGKHIFLQTSSRTQLQRSMPGWEMGCQSQVNRALLRKTQGLHLKKNNQRKRCSTCLVSRASHQVFSTLQRKGSAPGPHPSLWFGIDSLEAASLAGFGSPKNAKRFTRSTTA